MAPSRRTVLLFVAALLTAAPIRAFAGWTDWTSWTDIFASRGPGPSIGERAPAFQAIALDEEQEVWLDAARAGRPTALIFGSFT